MLRYGYPEFAAHKNQHESFVAKVREFMEKKAKGEADLSIQILNFLKDWLLNHIMIVDKKMGVFVLQKV